MAEEFKEVRKERGIYLTMYLKRRHPTFVAIENEGFIP